MHGQDKNSGVDTKAGLASGKPRSWRDAYPVLLGCIREGRSPTGDEVERLVARMGREIGTTGNSLWSRAGPVRRRMLVAAARAALFGRGDPQSLYSRFPLVLRGH